MRRFVFGAAMLVLIAFATPTLAQNGLVGTWEEVSQIVEGKQAQPATGPGGIRAGTAHVIYGADGHYITLTVGTGRPPAKPDAARTLEDYSSQYFSLFAQYGTYSVVGNKLTRKILAAVRPQNEGTEQVWTFELNQDTLVTRGQNAAGQAVEHRYRRAK